MPVLNPAWEAKLEVEWANPHSTSNFASLRDPTLMV